MKTSPTYDDILAVVRLVESGSRFSAFRLRLGDIEVDIKCANGTTRKSTSDLPAGTHVVKSPMVGTLYRAPDPAAAPFVEVGARVKPDTIVCIIEVMKLMNPVAAGVEGVVTHVLVENAQPVEFGQPLVAIAPK